MAKPLPSQARLKELLDYDPQAGVLVWKINRRGLVAGQLAGVSNTRTKYLVVGVDYESYVAHRIIWMWMTGEDPGDLEVDHIDHDRLNNRWTNLRLATVNQNRSNVAARNKTGLPKGVFPNGQRSFMARIRKDGEVYYLGSFETAEEAHQAYCEASEALHGNFACIT